MTKSILGLTNAAPKEPIKTRLSDYPEYQTEKLKLDELISLEASTIERLASMESAKQTAAGLEAKDAESLDRMADDMLKGKPEGKAVSFTLKVAIEECARERNSLRAVRLAIRKQRIKMDTIKSELKAKISKDKRPEYTAIVKDLGRATVALYRAAEAERKFRGAMLAEGSLDLSVLPPMALPEFDNGALVTAWLNKAIRSGYINPAEIPADGWPQPVGYGVDESKDKSALDPQHVPSGFYANSAPSPRHSGGDAWMNKARQTVQAAEAQQRLSRGESVGLAG
jgi:hypothetical protein